MKTVLILPDGSQISSGVAEQTSVQSLQLTQCVNPATQLECGGVCATMAEIRLLLQQPLTLEAGQEITILTDGTQVGIFRLEKPTQPTANTMVLTAYDRIVNLDRDLSDWLAGYNRWPCALSDLARDICAQCGLELTEAQIPNGDFLVEKWTQQGVTGRQLMQYIAQITGRFVRANAQGKAEFAWYTPAQVAIAPDSRQSRYVWVQDGDLRLEVPRLTAEAEGGDLALHSDLLQASYSGGDLCLTLEGDMPAVFYYQNSLSFEDYKTLPISRVVLRQSQQDVGVCYPQDGSNDNDYLITANPLLVGQKTELMKVAENLYRILQPMCYTPCTISVEATQLLQPGQIVQVMAPGGRFFTTCLMLKKRSGGKDILQCTGTYRRGTATELNNQSFRTLQGKVLNLRKDVDGLFVSHEDTQDNLAQLKLSIGGLQATVQQQSKDAAVLTTLTQSAEDLQLRIQNLENNGSFQVKTETGYTFDHNGLHIQKAGQQMESTLDHTGMYVRRGSKILLQANHQGVEATDVTVHNYLIVGEHARFEDYGSGTGCFWI